MGMLKSGRVTADDADGDALNPLRSLQTVPGACQLHIQQRRFAFVHAVTGIPELQPC